MRPPRVNISTVFAGQKLGIKEVDDGIWLVTFLDYDLGYIDLEQKTLRTLDNPIGPRSLPMSQVRDVTDVSGPDNGRIGGRGGIRTHGEREPTAVFKTAALNHSATRPDDAWIASARLSRPRPNVQAGRRDGLTSSRGYAKSGGRRWGFAGSVSYVRAGGNLSHWGRSHHRLGRAMDRQPSLRNGPGRPPMDRPIRMMLRFAPTSNPFAVEPWRRACRLGRWTASCPHSPTTRA